MQIYRQTSSSGKGKPKTTSSVSYHGFTVAMETNLTAHCPQFAAILDKEAIYMGKQRKALSPKAVTGDSTVGRPWSHY